MANWRWRGIAVIAVLASITTACSSGTKEATPKSKVAARFDAGPCPSPEPPVDALKTARCGTLTVPENRNKDDNRTIKLAVMTLPAKAEAAAKKPDPIVFLEGGPGGNAVGATEFLDAGGINHDRDVIVVTQRGTPSADPTLQCTEIDQFNARAIGLVYDAESTGKEHVAATTACHDRFVKTGIDVSAYNTTQNALDIVDLRKALNIGDYNLYGYSYGTYLAQTMMRDHPTGIRSVMIDSVVPTDKGSLAWTWSSLQESFGNIFRACADQPACRDRYPDLENRFNKLVSDLEAKPVTTTAEPPQGGPPVQVVIDGGALVNWLVAVPGAKAPAAIDALAKGNPGPIASRLAAAAGPPEPFGVGLTYGVFCSEWIPYEPESEILAAGKRAFPSYPDSVLRQAPQLPWETEDCGVWHVPKAPAHVREAVASSIPALVIAGTFDAKTSAQWAKYVADKLPHSTYFSVPGAGHWASIRNDCANSVVTAFYDDPAKKPDLACVGTQTIPPFD